MREEEVYENILHDIIYDFLVLMSDPSIFGETDYDKGYIDSLFETYKIIEEKLKLFGIIDLPVMSIMPSAESWHKDGYKTIQLPQSDC